jgi:hypothetical protein
MSADEIIQQFKALPENEQVQVVRFIGKQRREDFVLSRYPDKVTVGDLKLRLEKPDVSENKQYIITFIDHRLRRRYIVPIKAIPNGSKSGFLIMAVVCLLIETLQQFYKGDVETKGQNAEAFKRFFEGEAALFPNCAEHSKAFYTKIRCGILHQAETKSGYRILFKDGLLFDAEEKSINATAFLAAMETCLDNYLGRLRDCKSHQPLWTNAVKKLHFICDNCQAGEYGE